LWDDVRKQLFQHSDPILLEHAMEAIQSLLGTTTLANTNTTKMNELEDSLADSIREAIGDRDVESAAFEADEIRSLEGWLLRLALVIGTRNLKRIMEDTGGQEHRSLWGILECIAERGRLGYREEEKVRVQFPWTRLGGPLEN
jgi:cohesin complex subunit SA-1/2